MTIRQSYYHRIGVHTFSIRVAIDGTQPEPVTAMVCNNQSFTAAKPDSAGRQIMRIGYYLVESRFYKGLPQIQVWEITHIFAKTPEISSVSLKLIGDFAGGNWDTLDPPVQLQRMAIYTMCETALKRA